MKIVQPTLCDMLQLCAQARDDEREQYAAFRGLAWDAETVAVELFQKPGLKFALIQDSGDLVVMGGWDPVLEGVWQSWMVGTDAGWKAHWRSITKASRKIMDELFQNGGARRLQTNALASRAAACDWYVKGLKMEPEGIWRSFGLNGEDVASFARLNERRA